jgi:hypothetical protein
MPVISTLAARQRPMAAPMTIATTISTMPTPEMVRVARPMVATSAIAIPAMPNVLPALAVSCFDRPARLRMNSRAATM